VWAKLAATPYRAEFEGVDQPVPWTAADCQILLYDKTGAEVTADPVDGAALQAAQPLHAFEIFTVLPPRLLLYRRILPVEETEPAVPAADQTQAWTKVSPVHLASICDVSQPAGGGNFVQMDVPVFPSIRIYPFDGEEVYGASLQCQRATPASDPGTIDAAQEKWTYCVPTTALPLGADPLPDGSGDPFGVLHSKSMVDPARPEYIRIPGVHQRPRSAAGTFDALHKKRDNAGRFAEKIKVRHYFYYELESGTNLGAVGAAVIFDNAKHGHWTLVPFPLVSHPLAATDQWLPALATLWAQTGMKYDRQGGAAAPVHPEFDIAVVAKRARLVLPAVAGLFKLHSMHMEASGEVCELLTTEDAGDDMLLAALSEIVQDSDLYESERAEAIEAAVLAWISSGGDVANMSVSEARSCLDALELGESSEAASNVEETLVQIVEEGSRVQ
jgi:hypothetical protein